VPLGPHATVNSAAIAKLGNSAKAQVTQNNLIRVDNRNFMSLIFGSGSFWRMDHCKGDSACAISDCIYTRYTSPVV
jgi:hypothetical protein